MLASDDTCELFYRCRMKKDNGTSLLLEYLDIKVCKKAAGRPERVAADSWQEHGFHLHRECPGSLCKLLICLPAVDW
jgi:hypothetical protein